MTTEDEFVSRLDAARQAYVTARDALDELWPRYQASLALTPLLPGRSTPEVSGVDRELIAEWNRRAEAAAKTFDEFRKVSQLA